MNFSFRFAVWIPLVLCLSETSLVLATPIKRIPSHLKSLPICYFQDSRGQIFDLSVSCGFIRPNTCTESLGSESRDRVLADFCRQNEKCLLTNTCNEMPRSIYTPPPGTPVGTLLQKEFFV